MAIRVTCDIEGLEGNWVDVSERWTRAEFREYLDSSGDDVWDYWQRKVTACHLETEDGDAITDPAAVNEDVLDHLDLRLVGFVGTCLIHACSHLRSLGNAHARVSSNGSAATPTPAPTRQAN